MGSWMEAAWFVSSSTLMTVPSTKYFQGYMCIPILNFKSIYQLYIH